MTSNHHAPYVQGYTRATMVRTKRRETARWSKSHKTHPSSDCRLKLACMKPELLVIANQHVAVNTFSGLVHTARHTMGICCTRSRQSNRKEDAYHGVADDWGEVVTRQPQGNLRLDHLLNERLTIGKNPQQVVLRDISNERQKKYCFSFLILEISRALRAALVLRNKRRDQRSLLLFLRVCSSVGQSTRLISVGSQVQILSDPPI